MDLLREQLKQSGNEYALKAFERQRQNLREMGSIRVSQGESGVFGNAALKELVNSVMQASYDRGIIGANKKSTTKQIAAQKSKVMNTAMSRMNEAISKVAMNPAAIGLQIS